jgi:hypothetical protein
MIRRLGLFIAQSIGNRRQRAGRVLPVHAELLRATGRTAADDIETLVAASAAWARSRLALTGLQLDGSLESLAPLDERLEALREEIRGAPDNAQAALLWALGAYAGEVIRTAGGGQGTWRPFRPWTLAEFWSPELDLGERGTICPMQRVGKRFQSGPAHSVHDYAAKLLAL